MSEIEKLVDLIEELYNALGLDGDLEYYTIEDIIRLATNKIIEQDKIIETLSDSIDHYREFQ